MLPTLYFQTNFSIASQFTTLRVRTLISDWLKALLLAILQPDQMSKVTQLSNVHKIGTMAHWRLFFGQFINDFMHMGAILPSSRMLGRAAAAYLARKQGPVDVLEAGTGTGAFTQEITPLLSGGDTLDLVEINTLLLAYLKQQVEEGDKFPVEPGVRVNFINADLRSLGPGKQYDYIIFSLPLSNFPPSLVEEMLSLMVDRLKPGGVFSYVKYAFIGQIKYWGSNQAARAQMRLNQALINQFAEQYQIGQRLVWPNVPPTWVYYWQKPESTQ